MHYTFETPITALSGIGKVRAATFAKLGITTVRDLLYHFPRAFQNRGNIKLLAETEEGEVCATCLTVAASAKTVMLRGRGRMQMTKCRCFDASGVCELIFYNQPYLDKVLTTGAEFRFWGKVNRKGKNFTMSSPAYEPVTSFTKLPDFSPVYPLTEGLNSKAIAAAIAGVLATPDFAKDWDFVPEDVRRAADLMPLDEALRTIHNPPNFEVLDTARRRFIFEELYLFTLAMQKSHHTRESGDAPALFADNAPLADFFAAFPFAPTNAQRRTIDEIRADLAAPQGVPMTRLVSGDVGSGKTLCAAAAVYTAALGGVQSAMMAPTEILASQHYRDISPILAKFGITCELLTGATPAARRRKILAALADGTLSFVVGTHALLTETVAFANLGLVVTDEQHRFGVMQRAALQKKGRDPHVLVMSATPIPRTLALILYGDLSLSAVNEMPKGRQKVDTFVVDESYRARLVAFLDKQAAEGHQAYVVCPAVRTTTVEAGEGELLDFCYDRAAAIERAPLKTATEYGAELQALLPHRRIGILHGQMKSSEKDKVMGAFVRGEIDILVSTTVIEVGVNVPNATLMVIEDADRFGLSQLHQLRGRVGRGSDKSFCILVSSTHSENARERLDVIRSTTDGYQIAEADLRARGPGEFFPDATGDARQHGQGRFALANLCDDMEMLDLAVRAARDLLDVDPELALPANSVAKKALTALRMNAEASFS